MEKNDIINLLKKRPGYEVVFLLRQSDQRRQDLATYADTDGGTLERWLADAEEKKLITRDIGEVNDEPAVMYSLNCTIPSILIPVIEKRGGSGPRDTHPRFADTAKVHHWSAQNST